LLRLHYNNIIDVVVLLLLLL